MKLVVRFAIQFQRFLQVFASVAYARIAAYSTAAINTMKTTVEFVRP